MTEQPTPSVPTRTGSRARANERPVRCEALKVDSGKPCRRDAGAGTEHWGDGPCSDHDDGTWQRIEFADDYSARESFLAAVEAEPEKPTKELIEPLGYRKRDVHALELADPEFRESLADARGQDLETLRRVAWRRAIKDQSERMIELLLKMKDPDAAILRQSSTRFDGQLDVRGVPYLDMSAISSNSVSPERRAALEACESEAEVLALVVGWVNPSPEDLPRDGRPALELVAGEGAT